MGERLQGSPELHERNQEQLEQFGHERSAELAHEREKKLEKETGERNQEKARAEALEAAKQPEKDVTAPHHPEKRRDTPKQRKAKQAANFKITMKEAQSHMSPASRTFSKVIHAKAVEKTSETIGSTIARPNAILAGSVVAFLLSLITYVVAKHYGYPLTGSETIAAFVLGWAIGLLFDYLRVMITGKRA